MQPPKDRREYYSLVATIVFRKVIVPLLYVIAMWASLVSALFLVFEDMMRAAGIVSAIALFQIINVEFNKEFFGSRNAIQKQSKR